VKSLPEPDSSNSYAIARQSYVDLTPMQPDVQSNILVDAWSSIRKHPILVVCFLFLGVLGGIAAVLFTSPVYRAVTTVELLGLNESFMNMNVVDPQAGTGNYTATAINLQTQIRILESGSLRGPVLERLERETTPVVPPANGVFGKVRKALRIGSEDPVESLKNALRMAGLTTTAKVVPGTRILAITADSTSPEVAATYVNTLASEYMSQSSQIRSTTAQKTTQWLASQLEETKTKLEQAERRLQEFVRNSGVTFVAEQDTLANTKLKQLQQELATVQGERIARQSRMERVNSVPPDAQAEVIEDANLRNYQSHIADLRRERALLTTTLTPDHYKVKRIDAQIAELQSTFNQERTNVIRRIRSEFEEAQKKEKLLASAYAAQSKIVGGQADKAAEYGLLKREVDILRQTMNVMLQQTNQASVVSAVPTNNVRVIDPAAPPILPEKPAAVKYIAYASMLGLLFGAMVAFLIEWIRRHRSQSTISVPDEVGALLRIRDLGVIPSVVHQPENRRLALNWRKKAPEPPPLLSALESNGSARGSVFADSFRMVLASLTSEWMERGRARVMVVTSAGPGEGKTTVLSNLGIAMADIGRRVLLVNADLRKPHLEDVFSIKAESGLKELIEDESASFEALDSMIQETATPGLFVLPGGKATDAASKLFYSPKIPLLLERLNSKFDFILIDTPPMLQFAEARLLGRMSDGVILVVRSGQTDRETAIASSRRLAQDGIRVFGAILNDWRPEGPQANAYSKYYPAAKS
jgi:capsular exopolysaccharide synthesis family protein